MFRIFVLSWSLMSLATIASAQTNLLVNSDFEGAYAVNGVAEGWMNDSYSNWGDYDITFGRETRNAHSGNASQRMTCNRVGYIDKDRVSWIGHGAAQFRAGKPVALRKGRVYRVRAWLRAEGVASEGLAPVVQIRQANSPWWSHCDQTPVVDRQWQKVEFLWTSTVDDPTAVFIIKLTELGTVWVDDASVEELTVEEARRGLPTPPSGNLLHNGDLDLGVANWLGAVGWEHLEDQQFVIEQGDHGPCMKIVPSSGRAASVNSDVVPLTPGYPLQISCRVKASAATTVNFAATWQAAQHGLPQYCGAQAKVGTDWQFLKATGEAWFLPGGTYVFLRLWCVEPASLWIDDLQVRQDGKEGPDPRPRAAILADRHPLALYHAGEKPGLRLKTSTTPGRAVAFHWKVADLWGQSAMSGICKPQAGCREKIITCGSLARGWYRATVTWKDEGRDLRNECAFCVLPPLKRVGDPDKSPFGAHFQPGPIHLRLARAVGARWVRLWPPALTIWSRVEPKQGEWHWDDELVRKYLEEGLRVYGLLEAYPTWVSSKPEEFWKQWDNYVAHVVEHYKDLIHYWEVQNEPDLRYWASKPGGPTRAEAHLDCLRRTYAIIKKTDPTAVVVGGCYGGDFSKGADGLQFGQELIKGGGLQIMDAMSFHYYHGPSLPLPMDECADPIIDALPRYKAEMRAAGKEVPLFNSEGGTYNPASALTYRPPTVDNMAPMSPGHVARLLVRMYVTQIAAGVDRFFYYNFFIGGSPFAKAWDSFIEGDGQPRAAVSAYAVMTWMLDGAEFSKVDRPTKDLWLYRFTTPRGPLVVGWTRTGTQTACRLPTALRAWDVMGKETKLRPGGLVSLTPDPVYVLLRK